MSHLDLCTLEVVCAVKKTVIATLRVEMRTSVSLARNGNGYRKLRISAVGSTPAEYDYEWASAFGGDGDTLVDGVARELTLSYKIGHGSYTQGWLSQDVKVKVRKGGTYRVEILAVEPVTPNARVREEARPHFDAGAEARASTGTGNPFDGIFWDLPKPAPPRPSAANPIWTEIEAVLRRKRYTCGQDVARARKAVALLLHNDGPAAGQEMDALARANAYLDVQEAPFKGALAV